MLGIAAVAALAVGGLGATCGPAPPVTETCTPAVPTDAGDLPDGSLTSVELGYLGTGGDFVPFVDQGVAQLQFGGQGSSMYVTHLRLRGSGIPACLPQKTYLETLDGMVIASEEAGLATDPAGAGAWITGPMYLIYDRSSGVQVRLRTVVFGVERTVVVWVDIPGDVDAGVDAGVDAASDAGVDPDAAFAP